MHFLFHRSFVILLVPSSVVSTKNVSSLLFIFLFTFGSSFGYNRQFLKTRTTLQSTPLIDTTVNHSCFLCDLVQSSFFFCCFRIRQSPIFISFFLRVYSCFLLATLFSLSVRKRAANSTKHKAQVKTDYTCLHHGVGTLEHRESHETMTVRKTQSLSVIRLNFTCWSYDTADCAYPM